MKTASLTAAALFAVAAAAFGSSGTGQSGPAPVARALAEVVSEPVEVGSVFELEIVVEHPAGAEAAPVVEESLGGFRVMGAAPLEGDDDRPGESRFRLQLGAFVLPGDHEIPGVPVGIRTADGELSLIETLPAPVRVVSSLPPDPEEAGGDIHDLRGPFELSVPPRWGQIGLLALGLAILLAAAYWLWRRRGAREAPVVPLPPPAAEAEAALARAGARRTARIGRGGRLLRPARRDHEAVCRPAVRCPMERTDNRRDSAGPDGPYPVAAPGGAGAAGGDSG